MVAKQKYRDMDGNGPPIAVIGFAFEFPDGIRSEQAFWDVISNGRSTASSFPEDRININAFYNPDPSRISTLPLRQGHFIKENLGAFDAPFFNISPDEAACLDPQQRHMLETAYHALENAGLPSSKYCGSDTAVYTASFTNDYLNVVGRDHEVEQRHAALGVTDCMLANRLSWFFDFRGVSANIDTACSSSLVALHLACQELRSYSSNMALVGGASLDYHPDFWQMLSNGKFLSPDGRSWSFDERANGYARGEGIAVMIIKRLDDAIRDRDTIRAVIRNTGVNQDGRTPGITQPNMSAQTKLINDTYKHAKLEMDSTRFFEAHGTGTALGDPIEARAIGASFSKYRDAQNPLYIGAVKANIGHLEGASGLAGVLKTILVLEKGLIPPIADLNVLNPKIDATSLRLCFPRKVIEWPEPGLRRACVNSFGFGGTNAMAILDDAYHFLNRYGLDGHHQTILHPMDSCQKLRHSILQVHDQSSNSIKKHLQYDASHTSTKKLLIWSGFDNQSATRVRDLYCKYLNQNPHETQTLIQYLATKKSHLGWRGFEVVDTMEPAVATPLLSSQPIKALEHTSVAFVFTGQGAQYYGMGLGLCRYTAYRESLKSLDQKLSDLGCQWSLLSILDSRLEKTGTIGVEQSQVLTTCLQIALVDLLRDFKIVPSTVIGHSSGEIAAAYAAEAISHSSAAKIAYWRGVLCARLASTVNDQSMMAVGLSKDEANRYLVRSIKSGQALQIWIGCINSPRSVTLTGNLTQLLMLKAELDSASIFARILNVPVAYHSQYMQEVADEYLTNLGDLKSCCPSGGPTMVSSVTGDCIDPEDLCKADYWVQNMVSEVNFDGALSKLLQKSQAVKGKLFRGDENLLNEVTHIVEIGPHSTLKGPVKDTSQAVSGSKKPKYVNVLSRNMDACSSVLAAVGTLFCEGVSCNILPSHEITNQSMPIPLDLPRYPFKHEVTHWRESRISKNFRLRRAPRHDLLGTQNLDWNHNVAQWRNVIRLSEVPWLEDHKIKGIAVLPAAAMIAMAIEAHRQLQPNTGDSGGIEFKHVSFLRPMSFAEWKGTLEVQTNLSTTALASDCGTWFHFRLFAGDGPSYSECCSGFIRRIEAGKTKENLIDEAAFLGQNSSKEWTQLISEAPKSQVDEPYEIIGDSGVQYGPSFCNLREPGVDKDSETIVTTAQIDTHTWQSHSFDSTNQQFEVHPTVLDGIAQMLILGVNEKYGKYPAALPSHIKGILIDPRYNTSSKDSKIGAFVQCRTNGRRGLIADAVGVQTNSNEPFISFEGLQLTKIEDIDGLLDEEHQQHRDLCMQVSWKPDIDTMTNQQLADFCLKGSSQDCGKSLLSHETLEFAAWLLIGKAVSFLDCNPSLHLEGHLKQYEEWLRYHCIHSAPCVHNSEFGPVSKFSNIMMNDVLLQQVADSSFAGYFFVHVGRNLNSILSGQTDSLEFAFQDDLIDRWYDQMTTNEHHFRPLAQYLELLSFKNSAFKVLEIGAGTGGQTLQVLRALSSDGTQKCVQYDYTDISPSFFQRVRAKFEDFSEIVNYKVCDISRDPMGQGFEPESYDLILASHVLHATESIVTSLKNIRKLLKPGGRLVMMEHTCPDNVTVGFTTGILESWWRPLQHETRSTLSPLMNARDWNDKLQGSGFSGMDLDLSGYQGRHPIFGSIILSTASRTSIQQTLTNTSVAVVWNSQCSLQDSIGNMLLNCIPLSRRYSLRELRSADVPPSTTVIFLIEVDDMFLFKTTEEQYNDFKSVLLRFQRILWVSRSSPAELAPSHHLAVGLGRSLSSEDATKGFVTLELGSWQNNLEDIFQNLSRVLERFDQSSVEHMERNYKTTPQGLEICRIQRHNELNQHFVEAASDSRQKSIQLESGSQLSLKNTGSRTLGLQFYEEDSRPLAHSEVLVRVTAQGLSHRDILLDRGQLANLEPITEIAGVVELADPSSGFTPGQRVTTIVHGHGSTHIQIEADKLIRVPDGLDCAHVAATPVAAWISHYTLVTLGRIQEGDSVLIHKANSAIGQTIVHMATKLGARIFATASSPAKRQFLVEDCGIPSHRVYDSQDPSMSRKVFQATDGEGIDVVVGYLDTGIHEKILRLLAPFGRAVNLALATSSTSSTALEYAERKRNISWSGVDVAEIFTKRPRKAYSILKQAMNMAFDLNVRTPQPVHVFGADEVSSAFTHLGDTTQIGKRVIRYLPETHVMARMKSTHTPHFSANATYIISGGLGGLGRSIARWMVSRGARHLMLLSRSGATTHEAKRLVEELNQQNVVVATPQVDISDLSQVQCAVQHASTYLPPIKGCIQASAAFRDNLFENMTHEDWTISIGAKAAGSWNLHTTLPQTLDFFILLSSIGGLYGSRASANYSAGCTYQDALARYRVSQGLTAISIDLGMMIEDGIVSRNESMLTSFRRLGILTDMRTQDLLALLDYYCDPTLPAVASESQAQLLVGLELPSVVRANGFDVPHFMYRPIFGHLFRMRPAETTADTDNTGAERGTAKQQQLDWMARFATAGSKPDAVEVVNAWLVWKLSLLLGLPDTEIELGKPASDYGIDSLSAIDLKNGFLKDLRVKISVFDLTSSKSLGVLGESVVENHWVGRDEV